MPPCANSAEAIAAGFADYVALRDVELPITTTAGEAIAEIRKDGPPRQLPTSADFASTADGLGAVYEESWLACRVVADRAGQDALVRLYYRTDRGGDLDTALRDIVGLSTGAFTLAWQQRLAALAELQVHDASPLIEAWMPMFDVYAGPEISPLLSHDEIGVAANRISLAEHTGTHVDAPFTSTPTA